MAIKSLNKLHISLGSIHDLLNDYASELGQVQNSYSDIIAELEGSFVDSQAHWNKWDTNEERKASVDTGEELAKIDEIANGMISIECQLCSIDKSYKKRRDSEFALLTQDNAFPLSDDAEFLSLMQLKLQEAKEIADDCSLTAHGAIIQEIGMVFSKKRNEKYERLYSLIREADYIRNQAFLTLQARLSGTKAAIRTRKDGEIDNAADETAVLIQQAEEQWSQKLATLKKGYSEKLSSMFSSADMFSLVELKGALHEEGILPPFCREHMLLGEIKLDLADYLESTETINFINQHYADHINGHNLTVPAVYDLGEPTNFCFMTDPEGRSESKHAIHSVIFSLLCNQPASRQQFILADPEGRSKGFDIFLDFAKNHSSIMGEKIMTTQPQMKKKIDELSNYIDDVGQTKLVGYSNIFEYNEQVPDKQESLKCLCILDFPKYFDEAMLDSLYNIVSNGSAYGVSVMLQYSINETDNKLSQGSRSLIDRICSELICFSLENDNWHHPNGVQMYFNEIPTRTELAEFSGIFDKQFKDIRRTALPIERTLARSDWYTGDSAELLSVPIGKNEDGGTQCIEFGDVVGNGTSHHALVIGSLGSGKSTLLHTIIMNALTKYDPDELNLYLMDFKSGTEFKIYAQKSIPHIKLLALDAMQEFGQSILDELWEIQKDRSNLFKDLNVKDIAQYRKTTGKKMPRILVIADEFQMLFSEDNNRKVAYACGARMADFISLSRVYGIHFILATQTLSRLASGFAIRKSTLNEMHVRVGLQCTEMESGLLFGDASGRTAFSKMGTEKGSAVYVENDMRDVPVGFKVAYCNQETQIHLLDEVAHRFSILEPKDKTRVFIGDSIPDINDCEGFCNPDRNESLDTVPIFLGEPIKIAPPLSIDVERMKRSNLLIVGSDHSMLDRLAGLYLLNAMKSHPYVLPAAIKKSVYLIDGLTVLGDQMGHTVDVAVKYSSPDIAVAKSNGEAVSFVDEVYAIYEQRRARKLKVGLDKKAEYNTVHLVIHDLQWVDSMSLLLANKNIRQYIEKASPPPDRDDLFAYLPEESHKNDMTGLLDSLIDQAKLSIPTSNIPLYKKFLTLIDVGYTYGINVVLSCTDYQSIKELMYEIIPKFPNRIIFAMNNSEADRVVLEAKTENLRSNIVVYSDGKNPPCQFKPFSIGDGTFKIKLN